MRYKVTLDAYVIGGPALEQLPLPPLPGTTKVVELDTESGSGMEIWHGYLQMRQAQKVVQPSDSWARVKLTEKDSEIDKFREAINIFFRYLAGEGRDNGLQVTKIEAA